MVRRKVLLLCLAIGFLVTSCSPPVVAIVEKPTPPSITATPAWFIDPYVRNLALFILDYQTFAIKSAYFSRLSKCDSQHPPISEEKLEKKASGIFTATYEIDEIGFENKYMGELAVLEIIPIDIGGVAISDRCDGALLFAGSIIYMGTGKQLYPADPIDPQSLIHNNSTVPAPQKIELVIGTGVPPIGQEKSLAAWHSIQDLNLVQSLSSQPYQVLIYLFPRSVGMFDPSAAEWIIFVYQYQSKQ